MKKSILFSSVLSSLCIAENSLSDTQRFGSYLEELVISKELKAVLKAENSRRNETESVIASACAGICQVLLLADIYNEIFCLR